MQLYVLGDGHGKWFVNVTPTGRLRETDSLYEAAFFSGDSDLEDFASLLQRGYNLYLLNVSDPVIVAQGTNSIIDTQTLTTTGPAEVYNMDLFN